MQKEIIIIGGGGFAKTLVDAILKEGIYKIAGFCIDNVPVDNFVLQSFKVISDTPLSEIEVVNNYYFVVALGNNQIRQKFYENALKKCKPAVIIHPSAIIGSHVKIGEGSMVMANTIINPYTRIGRNSIVNSGVIIDHDCIIGDNVHLSIGSLIGSKSTISDNVTIPIGEIVNSSSKI
jgi:acetyltransferase EpsM